jgi:hypothetical protein
MNLQFDARNAVRVAAIALASFAALTAGNAQAQSHHAGGARGPGGAHFAHPGHPGFRPGGHFGPGYGRYAPRYRYYGRPGWVWGGVGLGLGLGLSSYYYDYPGYVAVQPDVVYGPPQPVPLVDGSAPVQAPAPLIYPRNGQDAAQTDADSNACSEWAGRQPNATADPSVFRRGIEACMDARGYTLR